MKAFPKQALAFRCLQNKSLENTVGKGEIARDEQFLLFPQCFLLFWRKFLQVLSVLKLSSANCFTFKDSKMCRFGKALNEFTLSMNKINNMQDTINLHNNSQIRMFLLLLLLVVDPILVDSFFCRSTVTVCKSHLVVGVTRVIFCLCVVLIVFVAKPHSSVGSLQDLRAGGPRLDPRLGQYSFRRLMIVIATGFIPLSPLSIVSVIVMWEISQWLGKNIVRKEFQESMDRCTDRRVIIKYC